MHDADLMAQQMCMGVTSSYRLPERLKDINTLSLWMSAKNTRQYQEKKSKRMVIFQGFYLIC